jgi:hypothetical protein
MHVHPIYISNFICLRKRGFGFRKRTEIQNAVFWDVAPCRSCVNRRFGGMYRLYLQGKKIRERGTSVSRWLQTSLPWRWRRYVPPKCRFTQDIHRATSQKTAFFIVAAVKTSNLTREIHAEIRTQTNTNKKQTTKFTATFLLTKKNLNVRFHH